jgi:hypothetical protein
VDLAWSDPGPQVPSPMGEQIPNAVFVDLPGLNHPQAFMHADLVLPDAKFLQAAGFTQTRAG